MNPTSTHSGSYHSPPQGVRVVPEVGGAPADGVRLCQVHKVRGEDQAEKADVQGRYQLLERGSKKKKRHRAFRMGTFHRAVLSW